MNDENERKSAQEVASKFEFKWGLIGNVMNHRNYTPV